MSWVYGKVIQLHIYRYRQILNRHIVNIAPCSIQEVFVVIYFIYSRVYLYPIFQISLSPHPHLSPLVSVSLLSMSESISVL